MYVEYHWDTQSDERFILVKDEKTNDIIRVLPGDFPLADSLDPSKWPKDSATFRFEWVEG